MRKSSIFFGALCLSFAPSLGCAQIQLDTAGNVTIGAASVPANLTVTGGLIIPGTINATGTYAIQVNGNTYMATYGTANAPNMVFHCTMLFDFKYMPSSTYRQPYLNSDGALCYNRSGQNNIQEIKPLQEDFSKILTLNPKTYKFKDSGEASVGYIPQELHDHDLKELVIYDGSKQPDDIDYRKLSIYAIEVIKAQDAHIKEMDSRLNQLQKSVSAMEQKLNASKNP